MMEELGKSMSDCNWKQQEIENLTKNLESIRVENHNIKQRLQSSQEQLEQMRKANDDLVLKIQEIDNLNDNQARNIANLNTN